MTSPEPPKRAAVSATGISRLQLFRVWLFVIVLGTSVAVMFPWFPNNTLVGHARPWQIAALAVAFALAEAVMIVLPYRNDSQTFSLAELPLVFALTFFTPHQALLAQLAGLLPILAIRHRQPPLRVAFNTAYALLMTEIATIIVRFFVPGPTHAGPGLWFAILGALAFTGPFSSLLVVAVRSLAAGRSLFADAPKLMLFGEANALTSASVGTLAAIASLVAPAMSVLAVVPMTLVFLAYRGYVREHVDRANVQFLYEATQSLHRSSEFEPSLRELLERARFMFRTDLAEIAVARPDQHGWFRLRVSVHAEEPATGQITDSPSWLATSSDVVVLHLVPGTEPHPLLTEMVVRDAMVAPLHGDNVPSGMIFVANRSSGSPYSDADRRLFGLLVDQVALALENGQLERSLLQLTELEDELRHQAMHDALTGLGNRAFFASHVANPATSVGAVLLIDLDDFKTINDSLGHAAGDEVLIIVSERLRRAVREGDIVVRLGGDEFAVLLCDVAHPSVATETAARISTSLGQPLRISERDVRIGASVGVAHVAPEETSLESMLRNADLAMYEAKRRGKGRHAVFEDGMDAAAHKRLELLTAMQHGVANGEFTLSYQPVVDLADGTVHSLEALLRWQHPKLGPISPDHFIGLAEESGLVIELGRWVLEQACRDAQKIRTTLNRDIALNVNVSPRQVQEDGFASLVASICASTGFPASALVLEITERTAIDETATVHTALQQLKKLGLKLAIDDFGTGYSSLSALHRLPIDIVKIDKSFVQALGSGRREAALVQSIVAMTASLGLTAVAEGVETEGHAWELRAMGCPLGQGYLFAAPLPAERITELLQLGLHFLLAGSEA